MLGIFCLDGIIVWIPKKSGPDQYMLGVRGYGECVAGVGVAMAVCV